MSDEIMKQRVALKEDGSPQRWHSDYETGTMTKADRGGWVRYADHIEYAEQRVMEALAEIKDLIKAIPDDELSKFDENPDFWTGALEAKCRSILIIINHLENLDKDKS